MNNWDYRRPKKQFISFENIIAWGLQFDEDDPEWGKYHNQALHFFAEAVKLFNGTYTYEKLEADGTTTIVHYPNLNITEEDLLNHYFEEYGSRLCARPVEIGRISLKDGKPMDLKNALSVVLDIIYRKTQKFVLFNRYKYLGLVKTTGFLYDPIENYRMVEKENSSGEREWGGTDTRTGSLETTPAGTESIDRTIKTDEVGHISVNGPIKTFTTTKDSSGKIVISEIELQDRDEVNIIGYARSSGVEQGKTKGATSAKIVNGEIVSTADTATGTNVENTAYSTTYDDTETDRKTGRSTVQGSVGESETQNSVSTQTHFMEGTIESGNPTAFGYTDTRSFNERKNTTTYNNLTDTEDKSETKTGDRTLTRSGNIGITTSQQMIESERDLVKFNVIEEFCKELNKIILLDVYDRGLPYWAIKTD